MGWKKVLGKTGRFVGKAVGKEIGIIPDETKISDETLAALHEVIEDAVAEGMYAAMKQIEAEQMAKFNEVIEEIKKEKCNHDDEITQLELDIMNKAN